MNKLASGLTLAAALSACACIAETVRLSMDDAIAQALDRNFAIRIERFEPSIAQQDVRLASGTFDPVVRSEYQYQRSELTGYLQDDESASFSFGVGSTLPWGTQWEASVEANDRTTPFDFETGGFSDTVTSFAGVIVTQPVLRNFGMDGSYSGVRIARESAAATWEGFRAQVMDTVTQTITAYQSLFFAQENLRIAERNRDLAEQLLKDNKKRVETGVMAPLDIVQAESEAAIREVSVISARSFLRQAQNALKSLIWDNPESVLDLEIDILRPEEPSYFEPVMARDYPFALQYRPEYLATSAGLNIRQIQVNQLGRNALPQLDIVGSYGRRGLDRSLNDSVDQAFSNGDSSYSIGAVFSMPFPNRSRSAEKVQAYLRRNQAEMGLQQLEQSIRLELDDAATQLNADWDRIKATRLARELSEKSLQAEEKKLQAGTSSTFVVLRLQSDLAIAEIREINALTDYAVSLAQYHRVRGRILDVHNISLKDNR